MTKSEKFETFRVGLEKLTRETGVVIGGCGCCGSPSLFEMTAEDKAPGTGYIYTKGKEGEFLSWEKKPAA